MGWTMEGMRKRGGDRSRNLLADDMCSALDLQEECWMYRME